MDSEGDIVFYGMKGESCEGFIRAVRKAAFAAGKIRDDTWMADFASTCFDGPALRFYQDLSPDAQGNWRLLCEVLLVKYPLSERFTGDAGVRFSSTFLTPFPAAEAAPPPAQSRKGRIKVIGENSADLGYIGDGNPPSDGSLGAGAPVDEALLLSYKSCGKLHEIVIKAGTSDFMSLTDKLAPVVVGDFP